MNLLILMELANMMNLMTFTNLVILGGSGEFGHYGEHSKTGDFDESGDSRQHGESVDSGWFGDFGVYESGESYGLTYKYMIIWSRVGYQYVRVNFIGVHVIQTLIASIFFFCLNMKNVIEIAHGFYFWYGN